jgi:hypothetical protein
MLMRFPETYRALHSVSTRPYSGTATPAISHFALKLMHQTSERGLMHQTKRGRGTKEEIMKIVIGGIEGVSQTAAEAEVANFAR